MASYPGRGGITRLGNENALYSGVDELSFSQTNLNWRIVESPGLNTDKDRKEEIARNAKARQLKKVRYFVVSCRRVLDSILL